MATLPWLKSRLAAIGMNAGTPVTKISDGLPVRSALFETGSGRYVASRQTAAAVILSKNGRNISLSLFPSGQSGHLAGVVSDEEAPYVEKDQIVRLGAEVKKIRDLPPEVRYTFRARNAAPWTVSLHEATHVWGESDRHRLQLAAALVGKPFVIRRFSSPEVEVRFFAADIRSGMELCLTHLTPSDVPNDYIGVRGPDQEILMHRRHADHVYVRLCDVCWSCGACMAEILPTG